MNRRLLDELLPQVRRNCLISDAHHWGSYSICGLLMRLRELYRFEAGLPHGALLPNQDVTAWIGRTEDRWREMAEKDLQPLTVDGRSFDPFQMDELNALLIPAGLLYGAGHGIHLKPLFFLAEHVRTEKRDGLRVHTAGREFARDLSLHPAMLRGFTVLARTYATEVLIFEKFEEMRALKRATALKRAFAAYGVGPDADPPAVQDVARAELDTYIHHEIGEAHATAELGEDWTRMFAGATRTRASVFARDLKDVLADTGTSGMLSHVIARQKKGSLLFFVPFLTGYRKALTRGLQDAILDFMETGDWHAVDEARQHCHREALALARELLAAWRRDSGGLEEAARRLIARSCPARGA